MFQGDVLADSAKVRVCKATRDSNVDLACLNQLLGYIPIRELLTEVVGRSSTRRRAECSAEAQRISFPPAHCN